MKMTTQKWISSALILTLVAALSAFSSASAKAKIIKSSSENVIEVSGQLIVESERKSFSANIEAVGGEVLELQNIHMPWNSCQLGEFVIEKLQPGEMGPEAGWFLVEVIQCFDDIYMPQRDKGQWVCPEIYEPVCAQPQMQSCAPGMACAQVMPQPRTFSNLCMAWAAGADFKEFGTCENRHL